MLTDLYEPEEDLEFNMGDIDSTMRRSTSSRIVKKGLSTIDRNKKKELLRASPTLMNGSVGEKGLNIVIAEEEEEDDPHSAIYRSGKK